MDEGVRPDEGEAFDELLVRHQAFAVPLFDLVDARDVFSSSRHTVFPQIFIADALQRSNALLDKHEITQTHLDINDRLGPKSRYGGAADVVDVPDLVAPRSQRRRPFLRARARP